MLEHRAISGDNESFARDLLGGFSDVCTRAGLDGVLAEVDLEDPRFVTDLATRLGNKAEFDARGPRNAKPGQLADCLIAALSLTLFDPPDRSISLAGELRAEVMAAISGAVEAELAVPQFREAVIATARGGCEERYAKAFDKISSGLDERGLRAPSPPKMPLDAVQAVQRLLAEARATVVARAANTAIDRAKQVIARVSTEAADRIDQPITHRLTPREVAIARVSDARASKAPESVVHSLLDSLTDLAGLAWRLATQSARPYSAAHTFAVGDVLEHPKFGRGTVKSADLQRIEVEFAEDTYTLVHARGAK